MSGIPPPPVPKEEKISPHFNHKNLSSHHQEPDYEVIEFGQYTNAPPLPTKNGSGESYKKIIYHFFRTA